MSRLSHLRRDPGPGWGQYDKNRRSDAGFGEQVGSYRNLVHFRLECSACSAAARFTKETPHSGMLYLYCDICSDIRVAGMARTVAAEWILCPGQSCHRYPVPISTATVSYDGFECCPICGTEWEDTPLETGQEYNLHADAPEDNLKKEHYLFQKDDEEKSAFDRKWGVTSIGGGESALSRKMDSLQRQVNAQADRAANAPSEEVQKRDDTQRDVIDRICDEIAPRLCHPDYFYAGDMELVRMGAKALYNFIMVNERSNLDPRTTLSILVGCVYSCWLRRLMDMCASKDPKVFDGRVAKFPAEGFWDGLVCKFTQDLAHEGYKLPADPASIVPWLNTVCEWEDNQKCGVRNTKAKKKAEKDKKKAARLASAQEQTQTQTQTSPKKQKV
jgi:hypothetical protein